MNERVKLLIICETLKCNNLQKRATKHLFLQIMPYLYLANER